MMIYNATYRNWMLYVTLFFDYTRLFENACAGKNIHFMCLKNLFSLKLTVNN